MENLAEKFGANNKISIQKTESSFNNIKKRDAYIFISLGIVSTLLSVCFHTIHLIQTDNKFLLVCNELIAQSFSHIGIGLVAIGAITIMLDMTHWTHYFETRLSKIVTEKEYLEKLDTDSLINLQTEVLKAYFKNDAIGGTDGFLNYYQRNIQNIIGMPFRKNAIMNILVKYNPDSSDELYITENISYTCMENSGKIQEKVYYQPEEGEHNKIVDLSVVLQHNNFKDNENNKNGKHSFNLQRLQELGACKEIDKGFELDITAYNLNSLRVDVKAVYVIDINRFFAWRMSHPSRNVTVIINYPNELSLSREFFFNEKDLFSENLDEVNGYYNLSIRDWLLPDEGVTLQLQKKAYPPTTQYNTHPST